VRLARPCPGLSWIRTGTGRSGWVLRADAHERIVAATRTVTARIVIVDALQDNAATFYEHPGLQTPTRHSSPRPESVIATALEP
jgi:hypothetical protein